MKKNKKKYYKLDDFHELVSVKESKKNADTEKLTRQFFAKRRQKINTTVKQTEI